MTAFVAGSVAGCFLILAGCVVFIIIRRRRKRRQSDVDRILFEGYEEEHTCKSAPISRKSSPKLAKRLSCPNAYGTVETVAHSVSTGDMLGYVEAIQPAADNENSCNSPGQPYQHNFLGATERAWNSLDSDPSAHRQPAGGGHGCIWFSTTYDATEQELAVNLVKLRELPGRGSDDANRDPYVNVFLLPDEQTCRRSKVIRKSLNPVFNETFHFQVGADELPTRSIKFSVYDVDRRRVRHSLGHVVVPLQTFEYTCSPVMWKTIDTSAHSVPPAGEVNVGLTYMPQVEQIKITILDARHLKVTTNGSDPDYSVRIEYYHGTKLLKTRHTQAYNAGSEARREAGQQAGREAGQQAGRVAGQQAEREAGQAATFNESFSFSTTGKSMDNCNFIISLVHTTETAQQVGTGLGHVALGSFMYARGAGLLHWQDMLANTRNTVTQWHHLTLQC